MKLIDVCSHWGHNTSFFLAVPGSSGDMHLISKPKSQIQTWCPQVSFASPLRYSAPTGRRHVAAGGDPPAARRGIVTRGSGERSRVLFLVPPRRVGGIAVPRAEIPFAPRGAKKQKKKTLLLLTFSTGSASRPPRGRDAPPVATLLRPVGAERKRALRGSSRFLAGILCGSPGTGRSLPACQFGWSALRCLYRQT